MTTQEEIDVMFASLLESIFQICSKTTFANVSRNVETIKGEYRDMLQFCKNHHKNPWHSIADGDLPEVDKRCLLSFQGAFYIGFRRANDSVFLEDECSFFTDIYDIEYWMEIPELPNN